MNVFKDENGFTLMEVVITSGLLGIIGLGVIYGTRTMKKMSKSSEQSSVVQSYNTQGLSDLKNLSQGLSWKKLDFTSTYVEPSVDNSIKKVAWGLSDVEGVSSLNDLDVTISDSGGSNFKVKRDSHSLVYTKNGKIGVSFSRCVPKNRYYNKKFTPTDAFNLSHVPLIIKNGKKNSIHCCKRGSGSLCNNKVESKASNYRFMTFNLRDKSTWRFTPTIGDQKYLLGSGFALYLNRDENPDSFKAFYFNLTDVCYKEDDKSNCNKAGILNLRSINGKITKTSVYESGQLIIQ